MLKGAVRLTAGGEHPVLGLLTPGVVMGVPDDLWNDELFLRVTESGHVEAAPISDQGMVQEALAEIQASRDLLPKLGALQDRTAHTLELGRRLDDRLAKIRPMLRNMRILREDLDAFVEQTQARVAQQTQRFEALTTELVEMVDISIRPYLAQVRTELSAPNTPIESAMAEESTLSAQTSDREIEEVQGAQ